MPGTSIRVVIEALTAVCDQFTAARLADDSNAITSEMAVDDQLETVNDQFTAAW